MAFWDRFKKKGENVEGATFKAGYAAGRVATGASNAGSWVKSKYNESGGARSAVAGAAAVGGGMILAGGRRAKEAVKDNYSVFFFMLLALAMHMLDWGTGFQRSTNLASVNWIFWLQILFAIVAYAVLSFDLRDDWTNWIRGFIPFLIAALVAYYLPLATNMTPAIGSLQGMNIVLNPMIHPVWIYFGVIFFKEQGLARAILLCLIILWSGYVLFGFVNEGNNFGKQMIKPGDYKNFVQFFVDWFDGAKRFISIVTTGVYKGVSNAWNETMYQATGGDMYYTGQVDSKAKEKLGVYIQDLKLASPQFYDDEPVSVWATLEARTLDKPIPINVACYTYDNKNKPLLMRDDIPKISGKLTPTNYFYVFKEDQEDIECFFDRLPSGMQTVGFKADFEFQTEAYFRTYFMDVNTLRSYKTENIDILKQFGITDTNPVAIYTNGPLMIGMQIKEPPVGIGEYRTGTSSGDIVANKISMRITIDNMWEGKVKDIKRLILMIPKGMNIISDESSQLKCGEFVFEEIGCGDVPEIGERCDDSINSIYRLKRGDMTNSSGTLSNTQIDKFKYISCPIIVSPASVLGNNPITAKYFKVLVDYNYSLDKTININIISTQVGGTGSNIGTTQFTGEEAKMRFNNSISDATYLKIYTQKEGDANRDVETKYSKLVLDRSKQAEVSYFLVKSIIKVESNWDPAASGNGGDSLGLMQIKKDAATSNSCGANYDKPELNIPCGTKVLSVLMNRMKSQSAPLNAKNIAAGYKGGISAVVKSKNCDGKLNYECEWDDSAHTVPNTGYAATREYAAAVESQYNDLVSQIGASA